MKEIMKPKRNTAAELSVILGKGYKGKVKGRALPRSKARIGGNKRIQRLLQ